jgi:DNA gyrase/topoisomerase IV subunit B
MWAGALSRATIPGLSGVYIVPHGPKAAGPAPKAADPVPNPADPVPKLADPVPKLTDPVPNPADPAPNPAPPPAVHYEIREIGRDHTPAVLKIIDEALVNASDHQKEHAGRPKAIDRVTRIQLEFNPISGLFSVENNGPGIPVEIHKGASEAASRTVYVPEVAFASFHAGRNMDKPPDSIKGGINGVGAKLINVHSKFFAVSTVANGMFYRQIFRDRMRTREDPQIFAARSTETRKLTDAQKAPHTRITFLPAYSELGYSLDPQGHLAPQDAADIEAWCRWRMFVLAAYVGPKTAVIFNGVVCPTTSAKALATLAVAHDPAAIVMGCAAKATKPPYSAHPWDIAVAVVPGAKRFAQISVINGVHCSKGAHITYFKKIFNEAVGVKLARAVKSKDKKSSVTDTCRQLFLVIIGALPGADWGGQRKDELQVVESLLHPYTIPATVLGRIAGAIADSLLRLSEKGIRSQQKRVEAEKYTPARKAGGRESARCALLTAEGDSAIALLRAGLTLGPAKNPGGPSFETHGIISLGGVIMNALKKVTPVVAAGGQVTLIRTEQLRENKVLEALGTVLGLDYTCRYETPAEVARLRYGSIIVCTDQDLDGTGKILPLVLVWFHVFWPNLIACGFVKRFMTPVIRVYAPARAQTAPHEFYYETEYLNLQEKDKPPGTPKYYKGLASHDDTEVVRMFRRFAETVYTFTLDDTAAELFKVYFGDQPSLRKEALASPVVFPSSAETREIHLSRQIPCSVQLQVDAKAYKLDDIQRKIPRLLDGIPVARRKVLAGALKRFSSENREIKIFQLGGYIAEKMFYHHGDASLNRTIVGMAQRFPGALQYPYLTGIGQFGTRHFGGDDAGSPRYINVRLAAPFAKAMYPAADTWMLPHVFEDGERAQPEYFVPVIPVALLESFDIPSEGWRHRSFARRLPDVVALTCAYLGRGEDAAANELVARIAAAAEAAPPGTRLEALPCPQGDAARLRDRYPLNVSLRGYGVHLSPAERAELIRPYKGYPHSFGWYYPEHNGGVTVLRVTELPLRKTTQSFLKDLEKSSRAAYIDEVQDYSSDAQIDVRVKLLPGAWDEICAKFGTPDADALEEFLLLRTTLKPFLNYYGHEGGVVEFEDDYHAVFFQWAPVRRDLYRHRLEREAVLLGLKISLEREVMRYISLARELDLAHKADETAACAALAERGFAPVAATVLHEPAYTPTAELAQLATRGESVSYDYILSLRERDLVQTAASQRAGKINAMATRLAEIETLLVEHPFAGASVWASEIENLVTVIDRGEKTNWRF